MTPDLIFFFILAFVAVVAAVAMLFTRNSIYAALLLILNFSMIAVFYLLLDAPFIAMAQITVYAGAIMVLFLFVIMLLGGQRPQSRGAMRWQLPMAIFLGLVLLVELAFLVITKGSSLPGFGKSPAGFGTPEQIGDYLFNQYLLPFEITSVLLLAAMVGAIVLTLKEKKK